VAVSGVPGPDGNALPAVGHILIDGEGAYSAEQELDDDAKINAMGMLNSSTIVLNTFLRL
jgi:hypothetical protein